VFYVNVLEPWIVFHHGRGSFNMWVRSIAWNNQPTSMVRFAGLLLLLLALIGPVLLPTPVLALDNASLEQGEQIFSSNCAACHMGGGNVIRANRSLTIRDLNAHLEEYQQDPLEAIEHQIEAGKNAMPSYEGKLSEAEIIAVATYVEQQAELGW